MHSKPEILIRVNPTRRYKEYLKPGALARLRDSKISTTTRSHHRYASLLLLNSVSNASPSQQLTESPPEFTPIHRGPHCFGRKKLGAARGFFIGGGVDRVGDGDVADAAAVVVGEVNHFISANNDLLVH